MEQLTAHFNTQKYVHLRDFVDQDNCAQLVAELRKLIANGGTWKDTQCPTSQAVRNSVAFDSLLEQLLPHFEAVSGKKLLPTYAYARMYIPGEELKVHTDRAACEISATLTLGFEGDVWPIYMGDYADNGRSVVDESGTTVTLTNEAEIKMGVGDAVLYKGMEKVHWRLPYKEGAWQAQVFLHYVDADGPHKEWVFDKRPALAHHAVFNNEYFWVNPGALSLEACAKLIAAAETVAGEDGEVGGDTNSVVDKKIRNVARTSMPVHVGIGATMAGVGLAANVKKWKFDITHANQCDFLRYDESGHYVAHLDTFMGPSHEETRKVTVLTFLNDDFEGGRLFLQVGHEKIYPPQNAGTMLAFPSFLLHGVEPVTAGVRRSIVTWLVGPWFK